jgi:hypothetical protein
LKFAEVTEPVAAPVPVIVTAPVALVVGLVPPGVYVTTIVQLPPAASTVLDEQEPPFAMVNAPVPVPPVLATVGAAVNVNGPAVAPVAVLLTVIVPVFVEVPPPLSSGFGALNAMVAPVTVNVGAPAVGVVPIGVVTVTARAVSAAPEAIAQDAFTVVLVGVPVIVQVTLAPRLTAVAPVRPLPVILTGTVVPLVPDVGAIELKVGPVTVKG